MSQLLQILSTNESVSAPDLERALRLQEERGQPLAEVLLSEAILHEDDLFFLLSRSLGVPVIPEERLLHLTLSPELRRRVPRSLARGGVLVPLDLDASRGSLSVAMCDPSDRALLDRLRRAGRVTEIRTYLARRSALLGAIRTIYGEEDEPPVVLAGTDVDDSEEEATTPLEPRRPEPGKVELDPALMEEIAAIGRSSGRAQVAEAAAEPSVTRTLRRTRAVTSRTPARQGPAPLPAEPAPTMPAAFSRPAPMPAIRRGRSLLHSPEERDPHLDAAVAAPGDDTIEVEVPPGASVDPVGVDSVELTPRLEPIPHEASLGAAEEARRALRVASPDSAHRALRVASPDSAHRALRVASPGASDDLDPLLKELLSSVGVLVSMLEERIDPSGGSQRDLGRISRLVARELGLPDLSVSRTALAAHLYGLDLALRRELGLGSLPRVTAAFAVQPSEPGGLGPSLRSLGAKALGLDESGQGDPVGVALISLVADYLELRAESEEDLSDLDTASQLLGAGGRDPSMVDALVRAVRSLSSAQRAPGRPR